MKPMTMLSKLLRYPHRAVFDVSPDAGIALRVNRPGGLTWSILEEVMRIQIETGELVYALDEFTVGELVDKLQDNGVLVERVSPYFLGRSARVLLDGDGDAGKQDGDIILGFRSELWTIYASYAAELRLAKAQVSLALKQMIITQSEDEWLDLWGDIYGVPRTDDESDSDYQSRIPAEAFRLRVNRYGIEKAVKDLSGLRVSIRETWPQMFRLDSSKLSSNHRLVDDDQWRYGYIQPVANSLFDWTGVLEIIDRNKAAGIVVLPPRVEITTLISDQLLGLVQLDIVDAYAALVRSSAENRLDWMRLSETRPHRNWRAGMEDYRTVTNITIGGTWVDSGPSWNIIRWDYGRTVDDLNGGTLSGIDDQRAPALLPFHENLDLAGYAGVAESYFLVAAAADSGRQWGDETWSDEAWGISPGLSPKAVTYKMDTDYADELLLQAIGRLHTTIHETIPSNIS